MRATLCLQCGHYQQLLDVHDPPPAHDAWTLWTDTAPEENDLTTCLTCGTPQLVTRSVPALLPLSADGRLDT
jgi:hypothetical protein